MDGKKAGQEPTSETLFVCFYFPPGEGVCYMHGQAHDVVLQCASNNR